MPGLTRRRFIARGAAVGAGLALGARVLSEPSPAATRNAVIVGGGLAGLTAAYELSRGGWGVTVLEADTRVGGRVHTVQLGGQHAEGGGEYIDTGHTSIRAYVNRFGLSLEDARRGFRGTEDLVLRRGRRKALEAVETRGVDRQVSRFYDRLDQLADPIDPANPGAAGATLD